MSSTGRNRGRRARLLARQSAMQCSTTARSTWTSWGRSRTNTHNAASTKYMHPHLTRRHREIHKWNDDAKIAHDGSAWWGADATANAYAVTKDTTIGNKEAVFWLCHKLVIVPTFMSGDPRCAVGCDKGGRETLSADALQHGWHQAACTMYSGVTLRHDRYLEEMAKTMRRDLGVLALTGQYLNRDYTSKRSTDLYIVFPGSVDDLPVAVDYTCACPFLARYRNTAKDDFKKFMGRREPRQSE